MGNLIDTLPKRERLRPRKAPYWARLLPKRFLGYRKSVFGDGTWIAKYEEHGSMPRRERVLGHESQLVSFEAADSAARLWFREVDAENPVERQRTVADACQAYVDAMHRQGRFKTGGDASRLFARFVSDTGFGRTALADLTAQVTQAWFDGLMANAPADPERRRAARATANRKLASVRAALNHAYRTLSWVDSDRGWTPVRPHGSLVKRDNPVKQRDAAFLTKPERQRLLACLKPDLADFCRALLLSGARPGEIAKLRVGDYTPATGELHVPFDTKVGGRTIIVSSQLRDLVERCAAGRASSVPLFARSDGRFWNNDSWKRPFKRAVKKAGLDSRVVPYCLRHTAITEFILAGIDSAIVAAWAGTSVRMIEQTYGHFRSETIVRLVDRVALL
jgi:integrase